jgi:hypothetical protein
MQFENVLKSGFSFTAVLLFFACSVAAAQEYKYDSNKKKDPFLPLISPSGHLLNWEPEEGILRLEGVMLDPHGGSIAIINGELVKVGEKIDEAVITKIEEDKVTVIQNNEKIVLELRREE